MNQTDKSETDSSAMRIWKFRLIPTIISLCVAALIGWGESNIPSEESYRLLGGLLAGAVALIPLLIISNSGNTRAAQVIHYTSMAFFTIGLIVMTALCIWCVNYVAYILTPGLMMLLLLSIVYYVGESGQ